MPNKKLFRNCILIVIFVALFTSACGSNDSKKEKSLPREVTSKEAQIFSQILTNNKELKNAKFFIAPTGGKGSDFTAEGKVDWENSRSSMQVTLKSLGEPDLSAISTTEIVYENYKGLDDIERAQNLEPRKWATRIISKGLYGIDAVSQFVISLTSDTPENPLLLKQDGAQFLGTQKSEGQDVFLFKKKDGDIVYYVNKDGILLGVKVKLEGFTQPMIIRFSDHGNGSVGLPEEKDVYSTDIIEGYFVNRPKF